MQCPNCGARAEGRFCASCGTALKAGGCRSCGEPLAPGARFCSRCGTTVGGGRAGLAARAPWIVAALAFIAVAGWLVYQSAEPDTTSAPGMTAPVGAPPGPGPMGGSMRENADRLFNRVMSEREAGNAEQSSFFLPMAIQAYNASGDLDADGLYHLAVLHNAAGQPDSARAVVDRILEAAPDHLLALAVGAEAATIAGDSATAAAQYRRFLDAFEVESVKPLPEYLDHARILPEYRAAAEAYLAARGD